MSPSTHQECEQMTHF